MSYMTHVVDLATVDGLEKNYVDRSLEDDKKLDEMLTEYDLELHVVKQKCMMGGRGARARAQDRRRRGDDFESSRRQ